jgi:DNA invertase Pin-like site-specific DNA recombinase/predicted nucleotidyltransferase
MAIYGYAREIEDGRTLEDQAAALTAAGALRVFSETAGGAKSDRRELARAVDALAAGDVLLVTRLDRLARSTRDLLRALDAIVKAGAGFRSLGEAWADTTSSHGRSASTVLRGLAAFERELIRARTGEGRERAKARGQRMGRPAKLTAQQKRETLVALARGAATQADLARRFHVSQSTISRLADTTAPLADPPRLDPETERAARAFMRHLAGRYSVREAIVFGSRARGDHGADSDADIAVVLNGARGNRTAAALDMAGVAFDVLLETGILVEALPLWEDEIARPESSRNPALIETIRREGVRL